MTLPAFSSDFRFGSVASMTDVQDAIDQIRTQLTVTPPAAFQWTESPANRFTSPADADGRFLSVNITRSSATRMTFTVRDQNGTVIRDGTIDISGTASAKIWSGQYHLWAQFKSGATFEIARASILDETPDPQSAHDKYVVANTHRDSAGTITANSDRVSFWFMEDNSGVQHLERGVFLFNASLTTQQMAAGSFQNNVVPVQYEDVGGFAYAGQLYQAVAVDDSKAFESQEFIALSDTLSGTLEVVGLIVGSATATHSRLALRVS